MTRDQQIYNDHNKLSIRELEEKYGLCKRQILAICRIQRLQEERDQFRQDSAMWKGKYYNAIIAQHKNR